jgi:hypothetical protein
MCPIKELVVTQGVITSLTISDCNLGSNNVIRLGEMLEVKRLDSLQLKSIVIDKANEEVLAYVLASSLKLHVKTFPEVSNLRDLQLGNVLSGMGAHRYREFFSVVGKLPSLESFGVTTSGELELLDALSGSIEFWRIRRLAVYTMEEMNYQPMFEAVVRSRHLLVFSFGSREHIVPLVTCRQLFDLALSPTSGLLEIQIVGGFNLNELHLWLPDEVDQNIATKRQLRRFDLGVQQIYETEYTFDRTNLQSLLPLLSGHLPYLHSIFCQERSFSQQMTWIRGRAPSDVRELIDQVAEQRIRNCVGMALFYPRVLPTVPSGL